MKHINDSKKGGTTMNKILAVIIFVMFISSCQNPSKNFIVWAGIYEYPTIDGLENYFEFWIGTNEGVIADFTTGIHPCSFVFSKEEVLIFHMHLGVDTLDIIYESISVLIQSSGICYGSNFC